MTRQELNPYLPSFEYVPDGEAHVFGDRVYLFGSHDRFNGALYCLNDYVSWSADVHDLSDWRYEGVIFRKDQDPRNPDARIVSDDINDFDEGILERIRHGITELDLPGMHQLWAPDVARGSDGRYYLYYCLDWRMPEVGVAVCDEPAGAYEFLGLVRHADGIPLGDRDGDLAQFDPSVFVDDDGKAYLYSGSAPIFAREDLRDLPMGSQVMEVEPDMVTVREGSCHRLLPSVFTSAGTGFEGHEFYEASSIRRVGDAYYLTYSSVRSQELCYAVSDRPDQGFRFGGTIVDIGNVGYAGRTQERAENPVGNTHGGIELIDGQWYVFYHRQTNRTDCSRQACAEKVFLDETGRIAQVEVSSCGLSKGPLAGRGFYPACACCHLSSADGAAPVGPAALDERYPYLTQDVPDLDPTEENMARDRVNPVQYVANLCDGAVVGYRSFAFRDLREITLCCRGDADGVVEVLADEEGEPSGVVSLSLEPSGSWREVSGCVSVPDGTCTLFLRYRGSGSLDLKGFVLKDVDDISRG